LESDSLTTVALWPLSRPVAARADKQNKLFLKGDAQGIYGQYPPAPLDDAAGKPKPAPTSRLELVYRTGKPGLWRDQADRDEVMIQVDIRPIVPDKRWWTCLRNLLQTNT